MSITIKQLAALAEEFDFDLADARTFLGHSEPKKRGRPSKAGSDSDSDDEPVKKCVGSACKKTASPKTKAASPKTKPASPKEKRGPSGYNLFMTANGTKVGAKLKKAAGDEKLARGVVASEVGKLWKGLTEKQREAWNAKAKA